MKRTNLVAAVLSLTAVCGPALADDAAPAAVWKSQEADFTYQGFTTRYTCDGLHDKLKRILQDLGARQGKDFEVYRSGCTESSGKPDPFPGAHIKISVLVPAEGANAPVQARWKAVTLGGKGIGYLDRGDCELLEQVKDRIVPLFTTRKVELSGSCIPHQASAGKPGLSLEVLALPEPPAAAAQ